MGNRPGAKKDEMCTQKAHENRTFLTSYCENIEVHEWGKAKEPQRECVPWTKPSPDLKIVISGLLCAH